jgi:hypothetical protein
MGYLRCCATCGYGQHHSHTSHRKSYPDCEQARVHNGPPLHALSGHSLYQGNWRSKPNQPNQRHQTAEFSVSAANGTWSLAASGSFAALCRFGSATSITSDSASPHIKVEMTENTGWGKLVCGDLSDGGNREA